MNFIEFYNTWIKEGCFSINQVYAWCPSFNRTNLSRWEKKSLIVKLRNGFYAFPEYKNMPDFTNYVANRIYRPSYISMFSVLSFHGIIPEAVTQITSVTSLKTMRFENQFGQFIYHSVKEDMMFGYIPLAAFESRHILTATPEKALIDILYLYPFYNSETDMINLRLDEDYMQEDFNRNLFETFLEKTRNQSLIKRGKILLSAYDL